MDTLTEARRIASNTARQRADVATRRAALAQLRPLDIVQVVDAEADRMLPPVPLWQVEETEEGSRVYLLSDWRRRTEGWVDFERRFSADGAELATDGSEVPKGRILVVPVLPVSDAAQLRRDLLARWQAAMAEVAAEIHARQMPSRLRALLNEDRAGNGEVDLQSFQETPLPEPEAASVREAWAAIAAGQAHRAGLHAELAEAMAQQAMQATPLTDGDVALLLSRLPADVVTRALALADQLRERFPPMKPK